MYKWLFWAITLIIFSSSLYILEWVESADVQPPQNSNITEISDSFLYQNLYTMSNTYCVFFYEEGSPFCNKMEDNLNRVKKDKYKQLQIYKLDIKKYPHVFNDMNLSGLPVTIIYTDRKETDRIMGKVSIHNLNLILGRITK